MGNFEGSRRQRLEWIKARTDLWQTNATALNLSAPQITNLKALVSAADGNANAAEIARDSSKAATRKFYDSMADLSELTRDLINVIKTYAETTNNPNVFVLSHVEPNSPPTPATAPSVPFEVTGFVSPTGEGTVTWSAERSGASSGIFFLVERKRAADATFNLIGGTAEKAFVDLDPRFGTGTVQYRVKAQRGGLTSSWSVPIAFTITSGGGFAVSQVSGNEGVQLAA